MLQCQDVIKPCCLPKQKIEICRKTSYVDPRHLNSITTILLLITNNIRLSDIHSQNKELKEIYRMTDLQILILTLFLGLFGLLINYLVKFFRSAVKSVEESKENENNDAIEVSNQAVVKIGIFDL